MSFVRLDEQILESSVWMDPDVSRVFITMLLMARPQVFEEDLEAYPVIGNTPTGNVVPAGTYGLVEASSDGIGARARLPQDVVDKALLELSSPDPRSKSPRDDGTRISRVDGGWVIKNYMKYRLKDHTAAARVRKMRGNIRAAVEESKAMRDAAVEVLEHLNKVAGKHFRPTPTNLTLIGARLRSGYSAKELKDVVNIKWGDWKGTEMEKYMRPATLFNKEKCDQYMGDLPSEE